MSYRPWGPHGQEVPQHTVLPNPTPSSLPQQIGGAAVDAAPVPSSGGSGGFLASVALSLIMLVLLWIPMACLYPLTTTAALIAGFASFALLIRALPADGAQVAVVAAVGVGAVVALMVDRVEYRLAQSQPFRLVRHVIRLALLGIWLVPIMQLVTGTTTPSTSTRYILAVMSHPVAVISYLVQPAHLAVWVLLLVGLHFLLWRPSALRDFWHRRLKYLGLK